MNTVAPFVYNVLGTPTLLQKMDAPDESLKELSFLHLPSWRLVAYLHECGGCEESDKVCAALFLNESTVGRIVSDCNRIFGKKAVERKANRFSLDLRRIETDAALFQSEVRRAEAETDIIRRTHLLRTAWDRVRGDFLAGFAESPNDWITKHQKRWRNRVAKVGQTLIDLYEQQGQPREAYEVVQKLAMLQPENEEIAAPLLRHETRFGELHSPGNGSLAEWVSFVRKLGKRGLTITLSEAAQFDAFFRAQWERLQSYHLISEQLSILEGSFDAELAATVYDISAETLDELRDRALLIECNGRYEIPTLIRDWIQKTMDAHRKAGLQETYHRQVITAFRSGLLLDWHITPEQQEYWKPNCHHLDVVISSLVDAPNLSRDNLMIYTAVFCLQSVTMFLPHRATDVYTLFYRHLTTAEQESLLSLYLHSYCGMLAAFQRNYILAAQHFKGSFQNQPIDAISWQQYHSTCNYLYSLHHAGNVTEAIEVAEMWIPLLRGWNNPVALYGPLKQYSESLLASGYFEDAHHAVCEAISLIPYLSSQPLLAPALYQKGLALAGFERDEEALAVFDEALGLFRQNPPDLHGEADCLQQLGKLHARKGQVNTGKRMVEEALQIYGKLDKPHSRAGCLRTLGDVLKIKGDIEGAKRAYCEGLAFWESEVEAGRSGANWVQRFRERLLSFTDRNETVCHY